MSEGARSTRRMQRIAENEVLFRTLNERIEEVTQSWHHDTISAVCECGHSDCFAPIDLSLEEYRQVVNDRRSGRRFIAKPGHEIPDVETVVERHTTYSIVEKPAPATDIAEGRA